MGEMPFSFVQSKGEVALIMTRALKVDLLEILYLEKPLQSYITLAKPGKREIQGKIGSNKADLT